MTGFSVEACLIFQSRTIRAGELPPRLARIALGVGVAIVSIAAPLVAFVYFGINYGPELVDFLGR